MKITDDMLTEWFPGDVKPVHTSVYDVQDRSIQCNCCCTWAHWDGRRFVRYGKVAGLLAVTQEVHGVRNWRGLKEKHHG